MILEGSLVNSCLSSSLCCWLQFMLLHWPVVCWSSSGGLLDCETFSNCYKLLLIMRIIMRYMLSRSFKWLQKPWMLPIIYDMSLSMLTPQHLQLWLTCHVPGGTFIICIPSRAYAFKYHHFQSFPHIFLPAGKLTARLFLTIFSAPTKMVSLLLTVIPEILILCFGLLLFHVLTEMYCILQCMSGFSWNTKTND